MENDKLKGTICHYRDKVWLIITLASVVPNNCIVILGKTSYWKDSAGIRNTTGSSLNEYTFVGRCQLLKIIVDDTY